MMYPTNVDAGRRKARDVYSATAAIGDLGGSFIDLPRGRRGPRATGYQSMGSMAVHAGDGGRFFGGRGFAG